jgi:hypothetical protein
MKTKEVKEEAIQDSRNRIDEYLSTVYAIIGFLNVYKFQIERSHGKVVLFQGRRLFLNELRDDFVTPDLGLITSERVGLIGEVKYSFPKDQNLWIDDFKQVKGYDTIVDGWPTVDGKVDSYDIILLVHQSRSRTVKDYYVDSVPDDEKVGRTFAIIEFNRSSQGKEYFHFRIEYGKLTHVGLNEQLYKGLELPFNVYLNLYSTIKIYDVEPPIPHLLHLIYECVIDKISGEGTFKKMTKKSKNNVNISLIDITHRLREVYSFKKLQSNKFANGQPEFPKQDWVRRAFDKLVEIEEGTWIDRNAGEFSYYLSQKESSIIDHYIIKCNSNHVSQPELF